MLKHGNNNEFQNSPHGKDMIVMDSLKNFVKQVDSINTWINQVDHITKDLEIELQIQTDARNKVELKVNILISYFKCMILICVNII